MRSTPDSQQEILVRLADGTYESASGDSPVPTALYYWDTSSLSFQVATSGGVGVGTEVEVQNFPALQAVSDGGSSLTVDGVFKEPRASGSSVSSVSGSASSVTLKASNADRLGIRVYNDSTATLYLKFGSSASSASYTVKMYPEDFYEDYQYTGLISGVWSSATGSALVTEIT
jgi:hypothetical protein